MKLLQLYKSFLAGGIALVVAPVLVSARSSGYTPPSTPANFHVTAITESSVTFAWTASKAGTDSNFVYEISESGFILNVGDVTSSTWTVDIAPGGTYSFDIFAIDSNNKASAPSPTVTVTLPTPPPPPPIIPAAPIITSVSSTPDTITVNWAEATPSNEVAGYDIFVNGATGYTYGEEFNGAYSTASAGTVINLTPGTTYSIAVVVESTTGNRATSQAVSVTTPVSPNNIPPAAPTNLVNEGSDGCGGDYISWNPSTSPYEPQAQITYRVYQNGVLDPYDTTVGQTTYIDIFPYEAVDPVSVYVVAVDQYGNVSPPSNTIIVNF